MEAGFGAGASSMVANGYQKRKAIAAIDLPPGFRFHPTDEEIIIYYLVKKVVDGRFCALAIGEADFNKCEPWDLPKMAKMGEKEWFFFSHRDRKYPTGIRTNRATKAGYWKATGKDKEIHKGRNSLVGMKKTLVFYLGRAPRGEKTNWIMHEYRLEGDVLISNRASSEEWVVCKVFHKNVEMTRNVELPGNVSLVNCHLANPSTLPPSTIPGFATNDGSKGKFASPSTMVSGDPNNFIAPSQNLGHTTMDNPFLTPTYTLDQENNICFPNAIFSSTAPPLAAPLGNQQGDGQSSMVFSNPCNAAPFSGVDQASVGVMPPPNMEHFSSNGSAFSRSQDTGLSTDQNMANDITSVPSFDQTLDQDLEGFNFINSLLDLDFLWT